MEERDVVLNHDFLFNDGFMGESVGELTTV